MRFLLILMEKYEYIRAKSFWKGKKLGGEGELATSKAVACSASHLLGFRTGTPGLEGSVAGPHPGPQ